MQVEKINYIGYYIDMKKYICRLLQSVVLSVPFVFIAYSIASGAIYAQHDPLPLTSVRYWAYQLQDLDTPGAVQKIVDTSYDMVVIDPTVTYDPDFDAAAMVAKIKASFASDGVHRKLVMAYIDIGQAEEWRWYWDGHTTYEEQGKCRQSFINAIRQWAPWVAACDPDGWAGNYPVAFWDPEWQDIVIYGTHLGAHLGLHFNSMLDEVIQDGFDGIYLDWVEAWEMDAVVTRANNEKKDPGAEMLNFIKAMGDYGKQFNPKFIVIQQNSSELINEVGVDALKQAVDGIAQEGVWWDGSGGFDDWNDPGGFDEQSCCTSYYLNRLLRYTAAGLPVFVCDYAVEHAKEVYASCEAHGFIGYVTRRSLSRLTTTPPDIAPVQVPVAEPFGSFDTPIEGESVSGSIAVTGWALDDSGIDWVKIYRESGEPHNLFYIGDAVFVEGARPDIEQAFPYYPGNRRAGWGYMLLTHFLPNKGNGKFVLHAVAKDISGNTTDLGTKTIMCDNAQAVKPFGAIDTPAQGGVVSGSQYLNWGWVITPQPNKIPIDGSTIDVWIDGNKVGHPTYNLYRSDIASLFSGYANSNGAVGYFILDTTSYANGVHTIQWTVKDSAGNTDGIGSRYFIIKN